MKKRGDGGVKKGCDFPSKTHACASQKCQKYQKLREQKDIHT